MQQTVIFTFSYSHYINKKSAKKKNTHSIKSRTTKPPNLFQKETQIN